MATSITVKVIVGLLALLVVIRLLGKKELSQLTPFDLSSTVTPDMLNIEPEESTLSHLLVDEGRVEKRVLKSIDKDEDWLIDQLESQGYHDVSQILYAEWSKENGLVVRRY